MALVTRENESQYGVDPAKRNEFYGRLKSGQQVGGNTWTHTGSGWDASPTAPNTGSMPSQPSGQLQPSPTPQRVTGGPDLAASPGTQPNANQDVLRSTLVGSLGTVQTAAAPPQITRVDHRDPAYPAGFFDRLSPGTPVEGRPGFTWQHDGQGWIQTNAGAAPPAGTTPGTTGGTPGTTGTPGGDIDTNVTTGGVDPAIQDAFRTQLINLLGTDINNAAITDADLAPQAAAYESGVNRQMAARRAELAHQAARGGYAGAGGVEQRLDKLAEEGGQAIGAYNAGLVGDKLEARRGELEMALNAAKELGLAGEANKLQAAIASLNARIGARGQDVQYQIANLDAGVRRELAQLSAQLQREGYSAQQQIAALDNAMKKYGIDIQGALGKGQLSLDYLQTMLQNQQFNDKLGFDMGTFAAGLNRDTFLAGLGG